MAEAKTLEAKTAKNIFKIPKAEIKEGPFKGDGVLEIKEGDILLVEGRKELIIKTGKDYHSYGSDEDGYPLYDYWEVSLETVGRFKEAIYVSEYISQTLNYSRAVLFIKDNLETLVEGLSDDYLKYNQQLKKAGL